MTVTGGSPFVVPLPGLATTLTSSVDDRLDQATALVRSYCGWHIATSLTQVFVQGTATRTIMLPSLYVTDVVSIVDPDATPYATPTDYVFSANGLLQRTGWAWWPANTVVTFTHGYDSAPADVAAVVQAVAQRALDNPGSAASQTTGPFSYTPSSPAALSLLEEEKRILDSYRVARSF